MTHQSNHHMENNWRNRWYEIIFEAETPAGKLFDVVLIWSIILSVITVILDSVHDIRNIYGNILYIVEWFFTILFTIEYILRLLCARRPVRYATSFFGIVDLLAVIPTYVSFFIPGSQSLLSIRTLRLLRIFRVFKLTSYISEAKIIISALRASRKKISVFLSAVIAIVVIVGSFMYVLEGEKNGFSNIPTSIYWAVVTLTTVGYGDISPQTPIGKTLASILMILGYGIIAVPTGIVTVEMSQAARKESSQKRCPNCDTDGHDPDANHCKQCGTHL